MSESADTKHGQRSVGRRRRFAVAGPLEDTYMDRDIAFVGYTYKRYDYLTRRNAI